MEDMCMELFPKTGLFSNPFLVVVMYRINAVSSVCLTQKTAAFADVAR